MIVAWSVLALILLAGVLLVRADLPEAPLLSRYGGPPSRFLTINGVRVHYRDEGDPAKTTLFLLHGSNVSLHAWEPWVKHLAGRFRLVTVDLPGHGFTGELPDDEYDGERVVAFLKQFVDALGLSRFVIGGNSYGGMLAWIYTVLHPEDVEKLILINAVGFPFRDPWLWRLAKLPLVEPLFIWVAPRWLVKATLLEAVADPAHLSEEQVTRYYELVRLPGKRRAQLIQNRIPYGYIARPELLNRLHAISQPTLVIWGEQDPWLPVSYGKRFSEAIPGARWVSYEDAGHLAMEEFPERSAEDAAAFIQA